jgi:hypothetical protein
MDRLMDWLWQTLELVWDIIKTGGVTGFVVLVVACLAIFFLVWLFLSVGTKEK